ncbi:hypothetical protein C8J56DRAFT_225653 [Mycena floridula]|nr:hypothetical protein C8J56DRAFT_225653 [Mycena floridula]
MSIAKDETAKDSQGNLQAALARTATRGIALYFSRPVRLFRPSKVSGWHSLRGLASKQGASLTPQYMVSLVKNSSWSLIPRHFIPPMVVNGLLGFVLWTTYSEVHATLDPHIGYHPTATAAISGAFAGLAQAIVAAPVENVRLLLEGETAYHSWTHAWKDVFTGTEPPKPLTKAEAIDNVRQVRTWMKDVAEMGHRGFDGWRWGCLKDLCGFSAFFSIFEITRRVALYAKTASKNYADAIPQGKGDSLKRNLPRMVHGLTLVFGGVTAGLVYEIVIKPWDAARRLVKISNHHESALHILKRHLRQDGLFSLFRDPNKAGKQSSNRAFYGMLRALGRLGPWGVGFLVWEAYGPGLNE